MSAITTRLNTASLQSAATSSATGGSASTGTGGPSTSSFEADDTRASNYARVQNQVWNWKPNDTGLDMP